MDECGVGEAFGVVVCHCLHSCMFVKSASLATVAHCVGIMMLVHSMTLPGRSDYSLFSCCERHR